MGYSSLYIIRVIHDRNMKKFKRDIQGKFAIKSDDYREVRSLRLTNNTWKALGIASVSYMGREQ